MTELDEQPDDPVSEPGRVAVGVIGLAFAGFAAVCIPCGLLTWLVSWYAVAPLALVGLVCSAFGRGLLRAAAGSLNLTLLAAGVVWWGIAIAFG